MKGEEMKQGMSRRSFVGVSALSLGALALAGCSGNGGADASAV